jgi:hypothetical protein
MLTAVRSSRAQQSSETIMVTAKGDSFLPLRERLFQGAAEHHSARRLDSFLFNGGTAAVLLATTSVALLVSGDVNIWVPRALSAFAAFWVGLERALSFGYRWRFHLEMENGYLRVLDLIDLHEVLPESEREPNLARITQELGYLRQRESGIPGSTKLEVAKDLPTGL